MLGPALRKCFELSGVVPLGVFVLVHVASYSQVTFGGSAFGVAPTTAFWLGLELLLVWLPLALHGALGVRISTEPLARSEPERSRAWLLRTTGPLILLFILLHAFWLRWPLLSGERDATDVSQMLAVRLSTTWNGVPLAAAFHLFGLAVVALHLGVGLPRFFLTWGMMSERRGRRVGLTLAVLLFALGAASVLELATGALIPRFLL